MTRVTEAVDNKGWMEGQGKARGGGCEGMGGGRTGCTNFFTANGTCIWQPQACKRCIASGDRTCEAEASRPIVSSLTAVNEQLLARMYRILRHGNEAVRRRWQCSLRRVPPLGCIAFFALQPITFRSHRVCERPFAANWFSRLRMGS